MLRRRQPWSCSLGGQDFCRDPGWSFGRPRCQDRPSCLGNAYHQSQSSLHDYRRPARRQGQSSHWQRRRGIWSAPYVSAYDGETGKLAWRFYTVPGDPAMSFESPLLEKAAKTWSGDGWKLGGGGTVWNAMAYDPELDQLYIGTGNGTPWSPKFRSPKGGDNLFTCSVIALKMETGEYIWHYQEVPADAWDFDSAEDIILADLVIDRRARKVLMQAPKNGIFYVLDRTSGELISAKSYTFVNWASGVDLKTGRQIGRA